MTLYVVHLFTQRKCIYIVLLANSETLEQNYAIVLIQFFYLAFQKDEKGTVFLDLWENYSFKGKVHQMDLAKSDVIR